MSIADFIKYLHILGCANKDLDRFFGPLCKFIEYCRFVVVQFYNTLWICAKAPMSCLSQKDENKTNNSSTFLKGH